MGAGSEDEALGWPHPNSRLQREENSGHVSEGEFVRFLTPHVPTVAYRRQLLLARLRFVQRYPTLDAWSQAALIERVGRVHKESLEEPSKRRAPGASRLGAPTISPSADARVYIAFLALRGSLQLDWEWLLGMRVLG